MSSRKKVVMMGKGDLAIRVANWFHESDDYEIVWVVPVMPEPWAEERDLPIVESGHYKHLPEPEGGAWDLAFSVFYDKIIRKRFINKCTRILNLHNGPLPKYRGVSPINWALKNGEVEHGVTIHEITPGVDDGPIVGQAKFSIYPDTDEVRDVYQRGIRFGWYLFEEIAPLLDGIVARPQNDDEATFYHSRDNHLLGERRYFTRAESAPRN